MLRSSKCLQIGNDLCLQVDFESQGFTRQKVVLEIHRIWKSIFNYEHDIMTFSWCPISALQILYWLWAGDFSTYPTHNLSHQAQVPLQDGAWIAGCLGTWSLLLPHEYTKWPTDYYNCFGLLCDSTYDLGLCLHLLLHWVVGAAQPGEHFFLLWCLKLVLFVSSKGPVIHEI